MTISGRLSKKCQKRSIETIALYHVLCKKSYEGGCKKFLIDSKARLDVTDKVDISYKKDKNST